MINKRIKIVVLGAGGRDFHNFNVCFRDNPQYKVVAFTASQIPNIEKRIYPPELSGRLYPRGIPIFAEEELPNFLRSHKIDEAIFAYSDLSHQEVMRRASIVLSLGASFRLLGPEATMLKSSVPIIAVCAVRTGCGKSPVTRIILKILQKNGKRVGVVRHPMPYGNLSSQIIQKFQTFTDLKKYNCTIEEMEEYEPIVANGGVVYAGVDYQKILAKAQKENDLIIWDGGNNDFSFFKPNLLITCCDPHRPGDELSYHPGETNLRMADVVIIGKQGTAGKKDIGEVLSNVKKINPKAIVINARSKIYSDKPHLIKNRVALVIEDGPTVTHGKMDSGAGVVFAKKLAKKLVNSRPWAKGSIASTFKKYPHIKSCLPAMGYGSEQIKELEETINAVHADVVVSATPIDITRFMKINKPVARVFYEFEEIGRPNLKDILKKFGLI